MQRDELLFERPQELQATAPAELRGLARDEVRLMVSSPAGHTHTRFMHLAQYLQPGDLLVVNRSATLPASLPAVAAIGSFRLNLSTDYGRGLWLAEPRWDFDRPGPLPLEVGETIAVAGSPATVLGAYPGLPRLRFVQLGEQARRLLHRWGEPIRYGYVRDPVSPLRLPDHLRPCARQRRDALRRPPVYQARAAKPQAPGRTDRQRAPTYRGLKPGGRDEPPGGAPNVRRAFCGPWGCRGGCQPARKEGRRVIAVGTTVVRALESAWDGCAVRPARGFTRTFIHPDRGVATVDGLISGFHDPLASHLAMLYAVAGQELVRDAYAQAVAHGYLWHEFGDSHLILR